jgi:outer membrane protein TolC
MGSIPEEIMIKDNITFTIGATLKMPLTPLFKVYQAGKLAQLGIDNVEVERRAKALAISYEVTEVYLKLVYAQLMNEVADEALETIGKHVEMAQKYEAVGMISHSDVLSAQVEQLKARQNVVEARNGTRLAGMKLAQVLSLGRGVEVKALEMPESAYSVQLDSLESYQKQAIERRTELERINIGQEAAERKRKMALLDYVPQVALFGSYQYANGFDILRPSNQGLVGLMMSWTVFDGLGHYYEARKASFEAAELSGKSEEAHELIELEVGQKYLALETALERVELTQQALSLAEENLRTVTAQFAQGESVNTDVLTAQTRYSAARADDVKARIDILIAYAGLKLSLGDNPTLEANALR